MITIKSAISNFRSPSLDRRWAFGFAALVMLVTTIPYLIGFSSQGSEWVFTGFVLGVEDGNSYLAKMLSGAAGAWAFRTPYTAYPQQGVLAFLPYLLIGKLAASPGLHIQLAVLFHLFRIASGFLAVLATFDFLSFLLSGKALRRFGLVLVVSGGGLGWVLVLLGKSSWLGSLPLEFYSPETFGFLGLYSIPHLSLARAALLWGLLAYLKRTRMHRSSPDPGQRTYFRSGFRIGFFWLLTALAQPLTALIFGGVISMHLTAAAFWLIWRSRIKPHNIIPATLQGLRIKPPRLISPSYAKEWARWKSCFLPAFWGALLPAPFLLYNALAFSLDPFLKAWTAQNRIHSPHPLHYLLAYGLLAPFAVIGARRLLIRRPWEGLFLITWVCALPFLAYVPLNLQRRLPEGIWAAAVVLALAAFDGRRSAISDKAQLSDTPVLRSFYPLLLAFPSTLLLLSGGILTALHPSEPVFRPAQEVRAFQFLQERAGRGEVVLCSYATGNALPAWAPVRTVIGHGPESVNLDGLLPRVVRFYSTATKDQERMELLSEFGVDFVFHGPLERSLGSWNPEGAPYLHLIYSSPNHLIYNVDLPKP